MIRFHYTHTQKKLGNGHGERFFLSILRTDEESKLKLKLEIKTDGRPLLTPSSIRWRRGLRPFCFLFFFRFGFECAVEKVKKENKRIRQRRPDVAIGLPCQQSHADAFFTLPFSFVFIFLSDSVSPANNGDKQTTKKKNKKKRNAGVATTLPTPLRRFFLFPQKNKKKDELATNTDRHRGSMSAIAHSRRPFADFGPSW